MLRKFLSCCLLALLLASTLCACGGGSNSFTWRVDTLPGNLDPQLASESSDITACLNLYSGLFRLDENGDVHPECCESYTVSPDGLTYTFTLKSGMTYNGYRGANNDTPVTAHDFAFGLYRVFLPETGSPYVDSLAGIEGSDRVLAGEGSGVFGVTALDETTLQIRLKQKDDGFLRRLCLPGAMPCNREFFEKSAGAYALSVRQVMGNGPFYLYNWTENGLFLRRKASGKLVDALRIVLHAEDGSTDAPATPVEQVSGGKSDAALYSGSGGTGLTELPYTNITWCLLYNTETNHLNHPGVRQALSQVALNSQYTLPEGYSVAEGLVPPSVSCGADGYREQVGRALPGRADAKALLRAALEEMGLSGIKGITVTIPDSAPAGDVFGLINQQWQSQLGIYCNVNAVPEEELASTLRSGQYSIILVPISMNSDSPRAWLDAFADGAAGWTDDVYSEMLSSLPRRNPDVRRLAEAERYLLANGSLTPLFYQSQLLLVSPDVEHLVFDPFGPTLDLTWTTKS